MITSKQNSLIKEIRSLSDKKFRDRLGLYVVEGSKIVKEAIDLRLPITAIVGTERGLNGFNCGGFRAELVTDEVFNSISSEVSPQGVIALIKKPENQLVSPTESCVLLDGVADPANVGAIIRTAAAAGYNTVFLTETCADQFSPKAVRSSMSGVFRVNTVRATTNELLSVINLPIYVADMDGENVFTHTPSGAFCLVIGNEGHGVSDAVRLKAKHTVSIPMQNGVESLNAAVSAALLMYNLKDKG